ncbi:uncharacterized protein SCHCODRAFT_02145077 [Schizophyllum commune H4-8]|uniref:uncharacterized protein n=1 Tax=Schizophyllum commune (strain H4-8 / FGSC 9210) TaxID=578458 RepID=UPI002160E111|nr:uncharacterized protein SCHCODRAFT_02145077 [Schizophyllum commune H4-8]KAI5897592.1 hypothetical protein SCHCODRAFT_02145077 [Schizophyllum commune H4-8]
MSLGTGRSIIPGNPAQRYRWLTPRKQYLRSFEGDVRLARHLHCPVSVPPRQVAVSPVNAHQGPALRISFNEFLLRNVYNPTRPCKLYSTHHQEPWLHDAHNDRPNGDQCHKRWLPMVAFVVHYTLQISHMGGSGTGGGSATAFSAAVPGRSEPCASFRRDAVDEHRAGLGSGAAWGVDVRWQRFNGMERGLGVKVELYPPAGDAVEHCISSEQSHVRDCRARHRRRGLRVGRPSKASVATEVERACAVGQNRASVEDRYRLSDELVG